VKLLPKEKKKAIWMVIVLLLSIGGIIYVNFSFGGPSEPAVTPEEMDAAIQRGFAGSDSVPGAADTAGEDQSYAGKSLNTDVFSDPRFLQLNLSPKLEILPEEVGRDNPFNPLDSSPAEGAEESAG